MIPYNPNEQYKYLESSMRFGGGFAVLFCQVEVKPGAGEQFVGYDRPWLWRHTERSVQAGEVGEVPSIFGRFFEQTPEISYAGFEHPKIVGVTPDGQVPVSSFPNFQECSDISRAGGIFSLK